MVEIPRCPNCDRVPNIHSEDGIYQRRCSCGVAGPVAGDLSMSDALWKEVICRVATTEPPAAGTVRVRIPVYAIGGGRMTLRMQYRPDKGWRDIIAEYSVAISDPVAYITADIPLPQPVEIPGTVEASDGE